MTPLDRALIADAGEPAGTPCPECDWRFLTDRGLRKHRSDRHESPTYDISREVAVGD